MAARAGARPVAVGGIEAVLDAVGPRTRALVICNPNDPTGSYVESASIVRILEALPDDVHVLVDEALAHFQDVEDVDACLRLTDDHPRLLVFRTFSKIYGLSGLRAGYVVASPGAGELLDAIAPVLGVNALTQSAVEQALKIGGPEVERRRQAVVRERARLLTGLRELGIAAEESQGNFVWMSAGGVSGADLANRLAEQGVLVAPGGPLGADDHVRAAVRNPAATDRLLAALANALR